MAEDFPLAGRQEKSKAAEPKTVEHRNSTLHGASTHKPAETGTTTARQTTSKSLGSSSVVGLGRKENRELERDSKQERSTATSHGGLSSLVGLSPRGQPSKPIHCAATASTCCEGVTFIGDAVSTTGQSKETGCGLVASGTNEGAVERSTNSRQWTRYLCFLGIHHQLLVCMFALLLTK